VGVLQVAVISVFLAAFLSSVVGCLAWFGQRVMTKLDNLGDRMTQIETKIQIKCPDN
jgi:hypothetical protein